MNHILRSTQIKAPIEDVWSYLTVPEKIAQWLMPNTFSAEPGHRFTMDCPPGIGSGAPIDCEVKEISPPRDGRARLVYSWIIDSPRTETLLEIDLMEAAGVTHLDLVHSGWAEGESELKTRHAQGWDHLLETALRRLLEH
ncbi:MAG: SRPBCC domain-containing protein [Stappiaceae bacterium]